MEPAQSIALFNSQIRNAGRQEALERVGRGIGEGSIAMPFAHSSARNLAVVCAATVGGIVVGGASVLGVALAVMEPPSHDAPAGSAVFDGQSHAVVRSAPDVVQPVPTPLAAPQATAAPPVPAVTPAVTVPPLAPLQPQPATPVQAQATPPVNAAPAATASINRGPVDSADPRTPTNTRTVTGAVTSRDYSQANGAPNADTTKRRTIIVVPANPQQARGDETDEVSTETSRPLFDFFGNFGDARRSDDRDALSQPQPLPPRGVKNPRDPRLAVPQRQSDPNDGDQDAANAGSPQYDSWDNFFGYSRNDNWHN
jgi:hypothetical protein